MFRLTRQFGCGNTFYFAPLFCKQQCQVFVTLVQPTSNDHALRQSSTCSTRSRSVTTLIRRFTIACCLSTPKLAVKIFSVMPVRRPRVSVLYLMIFLYRFYHSYVNPSPNTGFIHDSTSKFDLNYALRLCKRKRLNRSKCCLDIYHALIEHPTVRR